MPELLFISFNIYITKYWSGRTKPAFTIGSKNLPAKKMRKNIVQQELSPAGTTLPKIAFDTFAAFTKRFTFQQEKMRTYGA